MNDAAHGFDINAIRAQFPILAEKIRGKDLVFLDSAASAVQQQAANRMWAQMALLLSTLR